MNLALVSVIIPIYNSIKYINVCVESVLNQTYNNIEIILIDDGSDDGSYEFVIENYSINNKIKILTHENRSNRGVTESRRLGVNNAKGDYLSFLDSDDYFALNKLDLQVKILSEHSDVILVHSKVNFLNEIGDSFFYDFSFSNKDKKYLVNLNEFININHICNSTVLIRKKDFFKINITGNHAFQYEDWIQWVLLSEKGYFYYLNQETCYYRYHIMSSTAQLLKKRKLERYAILEKNIILEYMMRDSQNHYLVLESLQKSMAQVYYNLFYTNNAPFLSFEELSFKFYLFGILKKFRLIFKRFFGSFFEKLGI
jgi:glycosyltransferase involved in cell wall biosynthesis